MAFCNICQKPATCIARIKPDGYGKEVDVYRCDSCMSKERHVINKFRLNGHLVEMSVLKQSGEERRCNCEP